MKLFQIVHKTEHTRLNIGSFIQVGKHLKQDGSYNGAYIVVTSPVASQSDIILDVHTGSILCGPARSALHLSIKKDSFGKWTKSVNTYKIPA